MKTLVLLPVFSMLLVLMVSVFPEARGVGHTNITLHFVVLDEASSSPIPGAVVSLYDVDQPSMTEETETSTLGEAKLTRLFRFSFSGGSLLRRGKALVVFDTLCFKVSAYGYKTTRYRLSQFTGRIHDLELSNPKPIAVVRLGRLEESLAPGESSQSEFHGR